MKYAATALLLVLVLSLVSCGEDPVVPSRDDNLQVGELGEQLLARIETVDGIIEVRARDLTWDAEQSVAGFGVFLENRGATALVGPVRLVLQDVDPSSVTLQNADGFTLDGEPFKIFADEFGDDGGFPRSTRADISYDDYGDAGMTALQQPAGKQGAADGRHAAKQQLQGPEQPEQTRGPLPGALDSVRESLHDSPQPFPAGCIDAILRRLKPI